MSKIMQQFNRTQVRLNRELRRAAMAGDDYRQVQAVLTSLDDVRIACQAIISEHTTSIARFNEAGGRMTKSSETGDITLQVGRSSVTLRMDRDGKIDECATVTNRRDRDNLDIIWHMVRAILHRPLYQHLVTEIDEAEDRINQHTTILGYSELRRLIRGDTALTIMAINDLDDDSQEDIWDDSLA